MEGPLCYLEKVAKNGINNDFSEGVKSVHANPLIHYHSSKETVLDIVCATTQTELSGFGIVELKNRKLMVQMLYIKFSD